MLLSNKNAILIHSALFAKGLRITQDKQADYSGSSKPFQNLKACEQIGIPAWKGALIRTLDKISRLNVVADNRGCTHVAESLVDTTIDACNYLVLTLCLIIETLSPEQVKMLLDELDVQLEEC